jgi:hypothetical protein
MRWTGDETTAGPERCPGPDATVGPTAYFFVVSRAIVESDDIGMLSCDIPPMPVSAGVAAGAIAAVSAAGASAFFSPQPTITSTAASIMVFFIVAPDTLGVNTEPGSRATLPPRYGAEAKPGQGFVKANGNRRGVTGARLRRCKSFRGNVLATVILTPSNARGKDRVGGTSEPLPSLACFGRSFAEPALSGSEGLRMTVATTNDGAEYKDLIQLPTDER